MAGFDIRDMMSSVEEAPGKVWFWDLEKAVIDADRCVQCGACVAACPTDSIGIADDDLPTLVKMCTGCSLCWDFCPRGGMRHEATWKLDDAELEGEELFREETEKEENDESLDRLEDQNLEKITGDNAAAARARGLGLPQGISGTGLGTVRETYTARVKKDLPGVQDGGVVSALLISLLENDEIDGALLARESKTEAWKGEAFLATTPQDVIDCAGSFYNQTLALGHLDLKGYDLPPNPRIAVVGTPCETEAIKAMQARPWTWGSSQVEAVTLTIALLCTKSFDYERLMVEEVSRERGVPLSDIGRVDIIRGKFIVQGHDGETIFEEPIKNFHGAALKGCDECADFMGHAADISVGSVGSADGYSSVLVRSEEGVMAFENVREKLEMRDLDNPEALDKLDGLDKRIALKTLQREFDPDAPLFIDFEEHLENYAGTDRAPVVHDAVRY
ncbi:Coenzyme F420 hydrogenase/dehydrogenase, beta subunit C-terminal domain [Rubrobacter indicoceani]|uniref:Coenzyme F420 hydrogenase/dehydrogenase, beta subunit C-terminal domain n=1 Tax=Rubrobacter indicoceani TaxID=2051957 RepID=UPI001F08BD2C|nr:Coenzyme F420 hydrogenase/dehydrogenase, beta subunit C-terminal domain [Rubrobacter indicoceani]